MTEQDRFLQGVDTLKGLAKLLLFAAIVVVVSAIWLAFQVDARNDNIESIEDVVKDVQGFVDELRAPPTEEEIAQDRAVSEAVQQVPEIRDILCEQFPNATACLE